ncbi:hypothetical protein EYE40_09775 [Glaciihabitans arcticus]|uniref:DNA modification methylase n=1 Tax=Glaciihabitans arcticus TaxID=2668039 RepID=A0A4Q9GRQ3_9MICO|nr:hypothetical protein [Glaciihabitans arcticus]TBN57652.1 hypothetical protein EYE40_09775 [Glaciihabitans arcticus]
MIARRAAALSIAAALMLGTSGCTFFATQATLIEYAPSDGVQGTVGDVKVLNLLGISEDGTSVSLLGNFVNNSDENINVKLQYATADGKKTTVTIGIAAGTTVHLGGDGDEQLVLRDVDTTLGGLYDVYLQYGSEEGLSLKVPILEPTFEYSDLAPGEMPTPEPTGTPIPTETPAP